MIPYLGEVQFWHWWILAVVLMIAEVFAPGAFMMWLGIAAAIVGAVGLVIPDLTWKIEAILFAILSVISITVWWTYARKRPRKNQDEPTLNRRGAQYVGRVFTLEEPIVNGIGRIRVDDTTWKIAGADMAAGTRVKVAGVDNTVLNVAPVEA
jgi:inner membrane protein